MTFRFVPCNDAVKELLILVGILVAIVPVSVRVFTHRMSCLAVGSVSADMDDIAPPGRECPPKEMPLPPFVIVTPKPVIESAPPSAELAAAKRTERFEAPTADGVPIDICLNYSKRCGQESADAFCRAHGFTKAGAFTDGPKVAKTFVAGDSVFCEFPPPSDPVCTPFASITCIEL